jgi:hypothetical protein
MPDNSYHFFTTWRVKGSQREIMEIIGDAAALTRWWPSVYLDVQILEPGDAEGLGRVISLYTKGWLPYTLRWTFRVSEIGQNGFRLDASGDFVGYGIWTFTTEGEIVRVDYEWKIEAEKPILKKLTFLLRPLFEMNHRWAMERGHESLIIELMRRHAQTDAEKADIPAPPPATPSDPLKWIAAISGFQMSH